MSKIGIDFGTTNSSLVAYDKNQDTFHYFGSELEATKPTPSVVWYHDDRIDVGKTAKDNYNKFCDVSGHHMEMSIKSKLGLGKRMAIFGELVEPYSVAAKIIKHLKNIVINAEATKSGVSLDSAVFTIPVNFSGKQRVDLRKAAELSGIAVETFVHEPFAALIGHLYSNKNKGALRVPNNSYMLVFDWGGGTLDITVIKAENQQMYEMGTSELSGIAGDKFDLELANFVRNKFVEKHLAHFDAEYIDKMLDEKQDKLISMAEQCKIALSTTTESEIWVEYVLHNPKTKTTYDIEEKIIRSDFEKCIQRHLDSAINRIDVAIKNAGISPEEISFVLMTGGTSNIPLVRAAIEDKFGSRVQTASNPDMVIAQGAAVISEMGWVPYLSKNIMIELSDSSYWTAFEKGMPLVRGQSSERQEVFTCVDTRDSEAKLIVVEGITKTSKDRNLAVLNIPVNHVPSLREPDDVVINLSIDNNFVLSVKGHGVYIEAKRKTIEVYDICFGIEMR
ncbi:MAG: Hsp70 family protein [Oscillospiraceae bacterium]|nr:Hsp70 family protein [Oscillospiraceae bacterium]